MGGFGCCYGFILFSIIWPHQVMRSTGELLLFFLFFPPATWGNRSDRCSRQANNSLCQHTCTHTRYLNHPRSAVSVDTLDVIQRKKKAGFIFAREGALKKKGAPSGVRRFHITSFSWKLNLRDGLISKGFEAWGRKECRSKSLTAPNLTPVKVSATQMDALIKRQISVAFQRYYWKQLSTGQ